MDCRKWKLAVVGLALLCGACGRSAVPVPSPTAVPVDPAPLPAATGQVVEAPVPTDSKDRRCPPTEPSSGPDCDREVLLAARDVLRGANTDELRTWQRDRPLGSFEGVGVDPSSGRVVKIEDAWSTPLVGTIPPELGQLGHLQSLDLSFNRLTGSIPPELEQLDRLQSLDLNHNQLMGSIPPELGQLDHLQVLDLSFNRLTGTIPPELGQLDRLEWLSLDHNRLTGTIPPELGQLAHLQVLDLGFNRLTGCIPMSLEHLLQVRQLNLTGNRLMGTTLPAREQFNQSGIPPVADVYTDQAAHWGGQYRVRREGRQVTATLTVHRAPVGHGALPQPLFRLPEGYRPLWPRTWTAAARPMTARGRPLPEAPAVTVILEARPDGTVHHLGAPALDGAGYAGYHTAITWMTEETDPLLMTGTFTPTAGAGTVHLVRRGDTVTATLALPPGDGLGAGPSAPLFTVPAGFRPVEAVTWTVPATAQVPVGDGNDPETAPGSALELRVHRDGRMTQAASPRQAGFVATAVWRTADPGWMEVRGTYVPTEGEGTGTYGLRRDGTLVTATMTGAHGDLPASALFTVPAGFRPTQTVRWSVVVDTAACHTRILEVRPQGTVRLVGEPVGTGAEPPVHETTMTWTAGAGVCQRHPWVKARLLQTLRNSGLVRDSCAEITWMDLASVKSLNLKPAATRHAWLEGTPPLQAHDLAGLTGLQTLYLQGDVWFPAVPADLLFHTPALESLDLSGSRLRLPPGFLAHAPGLRQLVLQDLNPEGLSFLPPGQEVKDSEVSADFVELPPGFLAHAPGLRRLVLRDLDPEGLSFPPPELEVKDLEVSADFVELLPGFLAQVPELEYLTLDTLRLTALPVDFQTDTPNLHEVRDHRGCAVSVTDPADRPNLLARFLKACGNP